MIQSLTNRPLTPREAEIARVICLYTRDCPVSARGLARLMELSEREIKRTVQSLRMKHMLPIAASRLRGKSGYWWARTVEELKEAARPLINQGLAELKVAARIQNKARMLVMMGQEVLIDETTDTAS